jgi:hypothetical protein
LLGTSKDDDQPDCANSESGLSSQSTGTSSPLEIGTDKAGQGGEKLKSSLWNRRKSFASSMRKRSLLNDTALEQVRTIVLL